METPWMIAVDGLAILLLIFGLYYRRHHRRDLVTAFIVVNIGVLAVATVLSSMEVGLGVGLGLFGVLSIIRLRSSEISQHEVAYYFASLAVGLIAGFRGIDVLLSVVLIGLIVVAVAVADSPLLLGRSRQQTVRLDGVELDHAALRTRLEPIVGAPVQSLSIVRADMVDETMWVDVRWTAPRSGRGTEGSVEQGAEQERTEAGAGARTEEPAASAQSPEIVERPAAPRLESTGTQA